MKCPGQDMKYWKDDAIFEVKCPECSAMVEFYKDDTTRKCHKCSHRFVNPKLDFGCATYCQFAEQCLGSLPEDFVMQQDSLLKDKVAVEVKRYFKTDFKRIGYATKIARHAENIGKATEGANLALILCSSYLFNIGYTEANELHETVCRADMQKTGPAVAKNILEKLGADPMLVSQVCSIIGGKAVEDSDLQLTVTIVEDAYNLTELETEMGNEAAAEDVQRRTNLIATQEGKKEAERLIAART